MRAGEVAWSTTPELRAFGDVRWETGLAAKDMNLLASERLESAVERLATALDGWRAARARELQALRASTADMVPREELEALSAQLDDTLVRLRGALDEQDG